MKTLIVAAAMLAAAVTAAEAKCTKKSLNGSWAIGLSSISAVGTIAGGNFSATASGLTVDFSLSSFNSTKCRGSGTGTFDGTAGTVKLASEAIASTTGKPNHLLLTMTVGGQIIILPLQRQ
jgi:hypothetical protein